MGFENKFCCTFAKSASLATKTKKKGKSKEMVEESLLQEVAIAERWGNAGKHNMINKHWHTIWSKEMMTCDQDL